MNRFSGLSIPDKMKKLNRPKRSVSDSLFAPWFAASSPNEARKARLSAKITLAGTVVSFLFIVPQILNDHSPFEEQVFHLVANLLGSFAYLASYLICRTRHYAWAILALSLFLISVTSASAMNVPDTVVSTSLMFHSIALTISSFLVPLRFLIITYLFALVQELAFLFVKPDQIFTPIAVTILFVTSTFVMVYLGRRLTEALYDEVDDERARSLHVSRQTLIGEMVGGLIHQINNPIAVINGYAFKLKRNEDPEKRLEYADKILDAAQRVARTASSLMRMSKSDAKALEETLSVTEALEDAIEISEERLRLSSTQLLMELENPQAKIRIIRNDFTEVLLNLIGNAVDSVEKHSDRKIRIESKKSGPNIEIAVRDSGPKIPPEIQAELMRPFFTTKPVGKGTGLGLHASRLLMIRNKGTLAFDARSKETRFVMTVRDWSA
jgi:signal transduction histidine kinase